MSEVMNVPEGWEIKNFSELAKVNMGQSPDSAYVNENQEGMAFLQGNADFGEKNPKECYWVTEPKKVSKEGDILISVRAPVGDMNIADKEYCIGRGLASLTVNKIDPSYGFYALFEEKRQLDRLSQGSTFLAVGKNDFDVIKIKYPTDTKEQQKIAKILSIFDQTIEATQKLIAKEKYIKKGLMHDLLTNGIDQNGKIRSPQTHKYNESELGLIPEGWEVVELKDNLTYISYGFTNPMPTTENGPFMVTAADIKYGKISYQTCRKTSQDAFDNLLTQKSKPIKNDILLTKDGTLGRIALMDDSMICINQSVALLRPNNQVDAMFLKHLLESPMYQKKILDDAGGSTIKHIYITIIDKMKLAQPLGLLEQTQIANIITTQDKKIETEEKNLAKLKELKKGLMNDLLSGKVRVKM